MENSKQTKLKARLFWCQIKFTSKSQNCQKVPFSLVFIMLHSVSKQITVALMNLKGENFSSASSQVLFLGAISNSSLPFWYKNENAIVIFFHKVKV